MTNTSVFRRNNIILNGIKAKWINLCLVINILYLALARSKNPLKAIRNIKRITERRKKVRGFNKITRYVKSNGRYFWAEQIPGWPSKQFKKFIVGELIRCDPRDNRHSQMTTVIFSITGRCGLQCQHCFEWDNLNDKEHLSLEDLLAILEKVKGLRLTHIQFGGGEPLVRFNDLLVLVERAQCDMDSWILTSGFGLTREKAMRLKNAGLTGANISLDHWQVDAHNAFRNHQKSYHWVREAVKNCHEAGIIVSLALCATKEFVTQDNLNRYLDLAKEWGVGFVRILEPLKAGRFKDKDIKLEKKHVELLQKVYLQSYWEKKYCDYPIVMYPGFTQRQLGCLGAGNRYFYIDSKGDIHACPFCQDAAGNALNGSLEEAITRLKKNGCQLFELST